MKNPEYDDDGKYDAEYDVVVIGAGPAGSIAARVLAEKGVTVMVLEKKQEIGTPKRCGEGLDLNHLDVTIKPDPLWATNRICGGVVYAPNGKKVMVDKAVGHIIERKIFEKHLATDAIRLGARYMVKARAISVIKENGIVKGVTAEYMGTKFQVRSKIVIAADGVDSKIAKSAGLKTLNNPKDYHSGFQYEMAGMKNVNFSTLHLFFGTKIAPKGYVWIFPKGEGIANVGIGVPGTGSSEDSYGMSARDYLDRFIENNPDIFEDASPLEINAGGVPLSSSTETFVTDGLMVVGDAAHQINPIHGGGLVIGMNAAKFAADVAAKAIQENNTSRDRLYEYEETWRETTGKRMQNLLKLRMFLEKLTDEDFNKLADIFDGENMMELLDAKYKFMLKLFLTKAPKMLPLARKFLY